MTNLVKNELDIDDMLLLMWKWCHILVVWLCTLSLWVSDLGSWHFSYFLTYPH